MLTFFDFTHHPVKGLFKIIDRLALDVSNLDV
jgi:hypothetical protein